MLAQKPTRCTIKVMTAGSRPALQNGIKRGQTRPLRDTTFN